MLAKTLPVFQLVSMAFQQREELISFSFSFSFFLFSSISCSPPLPLLLLLFHLQLIFIFLFIFLFCSCSASFSSSSSSASSSSSSSSSSYSSASSSSFVSSSSLMKQNIAFGIQKTVIIILYGQDIISCSRETSKRETEFIGKGKRERQSRISQTEVNQEPLRGE